MAADTTPKLTPKQSEVVKRLYQEFNEPVDQLPYTRLFEKMVSTFTARTQRVITLRQFWMAILYMRKQGTLGKLARPGS